MEEQETPSFYAILPANVRYDNRLTADEKILYCEITAMMKKTGMCWASNKYFADLFGVTKETISRRISHLYSLNYISVQVLKDATTKEVIERTITLPQIEYSQQSIPIDTEINRGIDAKIKENITGNINNTSNNKENIIKEIFEYWNLKKIVVHKTLTDEMKKQITKSLKQYSIEEIKTYIDRYSKVINDTTYMYDYKWTLIEFLSRKNGISSFADDGSKWINYNNYLNNNNNKYKVQQPKQKQDCPYDVKKIGLHFD